MAKWPEKTNWPKLEELNGGKEFERNTPVTYDIFNKIVLALIYIFATISSEH